MKLIKRYKENSAWYVWLYSLARKLWKKLTIDSKFEDHHFNILCITHAQLILNYNLINGYSIFIYYNFTIYCMNFFKKKQALISIIYVLSNVYT